MITQEELKRLFIYTPSTGRFIRRIPVGTAFKALTPVGSYDMHGYDTVRIHRKAYKLHRLAWLYMHGEMPDGDIDHINGDRKDNRIDNLRVVSRRINLQNQRKASSQNRSTGVLGVHRNRNGKRFIAAISMFNEKIYLGTYDTVEEAYAVYVSAKRRLHEGNML